MITSYAIEDLLPHTAPAILLDKAVGYGEKFAEAEITIRPDLPFYKTGKGIPAHVGLEYMAQCCGVYAGLYGKEQNAPVKMGFLLGTRNFSSTKNWFTEGSVLTIRAEEDFNHDGMGRFSCSIHCNNETVATADLTVYQPQQDIL